MSRRTFLRKVSALGLGSILGQSLAVEADPPPEVRKIRLVHFPAICVAPGYLARDLLMAEGFDEVEYVETDVNSISTTIATGLADIWFDAAPSLVNLLAAQDTVVAVAGIHSGCYELLAKPNLRSIRDLKDRSVSISGFGSTEHIFVSSMAAYVGLDPRKDIDWKVMNTTEATMQAFVDGHADAFLGFAPQPQQLRSSRNSHVIVNTTHDRPWSQYFCCMLTVNRNFARRHPVAAKRAIRAFLKGAELCATQPEQVARFMVNKGYAASYEIALEVLGELPYRRWRDTNPEDTIRFHALRLHEGGIIQTSPQKLITRGTDWSFLREIRKELKA